MGGSKGAVGRRERGVVGGDKGVRSKVGIIKGRKGGVEGGLGGDV